MTLRLRLLIRLRPVLRFINQRILHTDDSPQRIGRGIATGLFVAFLPLFGLHLLLSLLLSALLRGNKAMALLFVWISNPLTAPFLYYPCYRLGHFCLRFSQPEPIASAEQIERIFIETLSFERLFRNFFSPELWRQIWQLFLTIGQEMLLGGILIGLVTAKIGYFLSVAFITFHRTRRANRRAGRPMIPN